MLILGTALIVAMILCAYVVIEMRINQQKCECGYSVSIDALPEKCPRCGSTIAERENY